MKTTQDAVQLANKAADQAEREFIKGTGFGLTDKELLQLQQAVCTVFNAAIRKERAEKKD